MFYTAQVEVNERKSANTYTTWIEKDCFYGWFPIGSDKVGQKTHTGIYSVLKDV